MPTKRFALAATTLALVGACSSTKTLAPGPEACNEGSILLSLACGQNVSSDEDVKVILTRSSDGKERTYDQSLSCDRPRTIQVTLDEYEVGTSFRAQVTGAEGEVLFDGTRDLPETCLYWSVTASRGEPDSNDKKDAGVVEPSDGGDMSGKDASPDVREVVVEAGVKLGQGMACSKNEHCATEFCIDGVCCESSCAGTCRACSKSRTGKPDGDCANVADGEDPDSECAASDKSECGSNGFCDGAGSCRKWDPQTQCAAAACTAEGARPAAFCDGQGKCSESPIQKCNEYACTNGACNRECQSDADCASGVQCVNKLCGGKRANGDACTTGDECSTGKCVDKVCCGSDCNGLCEACVAAKTGMPDGTCAAVKEGEDPDNECASETQNKCGRTGVCDGARKCAVQPAGTQCAAAQCTNGKARPALVCNGSGTCLEVQESACGNFKCGSDKCISPCKGDGDCISSAYCDGGVCYPRKPKGRDCTKDSECTSGLVCSSDGVCCNNKCSSACSSCLASRTGKTTGECQPMATGEKDTRCSTMAPSTCGTTGVCDGAGQCAKHSVGVVCAAAACSSDKSKEVRARTCDGAGACRPAEEKACAPGLCGASNECTNQCTTNANCAPGVECLNATCGGKLSRGQQCTSSSQCQTGLTCVSGFCCESACSGACEACAKSATGQDDGLCRPILSGQVPKASGGCPAQSGCGLTGKCGGAGSCQYTANGTPCQAAICSGNSYVAPTSCDGTGTCRAPQAGVDCGAYKCATQGCKTTCSTAADCSAPFYKCGANNKCELKRIKGMFQQGVADGGPLVVLMEDTIYSYNFATEKWTSTAYPPRTANHYLPVDCAYYAIPKQTGRPIQYYLGDATKLAYVVENSQAGDWYYVDIQTAFKFPNVAGVEAGKDIWTAVNAPFEKVKTPLDTCYIVNDANGGEALVLWRGTTTYIIPNDATAPWFKGENYPSTTQTYWASTNAPFENGDVRPTDAGYFNRHTRHFYMVRGDTFYFLENTDADGNTKVWVKKNLLKEKVPYTKTNQIDFTAPGGPYSP